MGRIKEDFEMEVVERADELATKQTGREFSDLPSVLQISIWSKAEEDVRNDWITAAEYYPRREER
jgi:hypothetical protein